MGEELHGHWPVGTRGTEWYPILTAAKATAERSLVGESLEHGTEVCEVPLSPQLWSHPHLKIRKGS